MFQVMDATEFAPAVVLLVVTAEVVPEPVALTAKT
jgi:hypothetical protein